MKRAFLKEFLYLLCGCALLTATGCKKCFECYMVEECRIYVSNSGDSIFSCNKFASVDTNVYTTYTTYFYANTPVEVCDKYIIESIENKGDSGIEK